jgi:hypothetical protein
LGASGTDDAATGPKGSYGFEINLDGIFGIYI